MNNERKILRNIFYKRYINVYLATRIKKKNMTDTVDFANEETDNILAMPSVIMCEMVDAYACSFTDRNAGIFFRSDFFRLKPVAEVSIR